MSLKSRQWDTPNKMHFESDFVTFNKQTNLISTGNVIANTQISSFIRPWKEKKCNGRIYPNGYLMLQDINKFHFLPEKIREFLVSHERDKECILYEFFCVDKNGLSDTFAYVITDDVNNYIMHDIICGYKASVKKRVSALLNILPYICSEESLAAEKSLTFLRRIL